MFFSSSAEHLIPILGVACCFHLSEQISLLCLALNILLQNSLSIEKSGNVNLSFFCILCLGA